MLSRVKLEGFKSLREIDLELRDLNILIGANGAGKSNFISFFEMLENMMSKRLAQYVGMHGGASSHLYYGPTKTDQIRFFLQGENDEGVRYGCQLTYAARDTFVFSEETIVRVKAEDGQSDIVLQTDGGYGETRVGEKPLEQLQQIADTTSDFFSIWHPAERLLRGVKDCYVYHFHDTGRKAPIRQNVATDRNRYLFQNAGNLAAVLFRLKSEQPEYYDRIVRTIRQIAPFFDDFDFPHPGDDPEYVQLDWREKGEEYPFGPHQLSDGTLRAMALITLLFQPESDLPELIILDEPELGFHPYAISVLGGLLRHVSEYSQVIVATQSPTLVDQFEVEDLIVAQREDKATTLTRPEPKKFESWLEEYTLSELWEKNVLGGTP